MKGNWVVGFFEMSAITGAAYLLGTYCNSVQIGIAVFLLGYAFKPWVR